MSDCRGRLEGKAVLVTGGGSGIGRAICELFAKEGAHIAVVDVDEKTALDTVALLEHGQHCVVKADVTDADDVKRAFEEAEKKFGKKCDVVVNNAGIVGRQNPVCDITQREFEAVLSVNLTGVFLVAREYLNSVKSVDKAVRGVLINTSSIAGKIGFPSNGEYAASKGGVASLSKTIAGEFNIHRVRCNAVQPGFTETAMLESVDPAIVAALGKFIPLQRHATVEEIAYGFLYLASDESSYVHGTCLEITGGM